MFILSKQRDKNVVDAFARYSHYLRENRDQFPESAYHLAISEWYFNFEISGCPHDSWLERIRISEPSSGERSEKRTVEIEIELLGAYHDGIITFRYPEVFRYRLDGRDLSRGHNDWRYDEFRLNDEGHLIHEIEWTGLEANGQWVIEASDIEYNWSPFKDGTSHTNRP